MKSARCCHPLQLCLLRSLFSSPRLPSLLVHLLRKRKARKSRHRPKIRDRPSRTALSHPRHEVWECFPGRRRRRRWRQRTARPPPRSNPGWAELREKKDDDAPGFYIPSGAFFEVQLLTGLDAPTGAKAKSSPSPILFRIQNLAWLPNEVKQNVLGCFLLSEGIGELSTERVNIRGLSISCVDNEGKTAIDQKILGFVADSDGKAGLRGPVASKAGALLAQTMKAGFVQGLAEFFSFSSRSVSITEFRGGLSVPDTEEYGKNLAGGAFSGMSKALEKVSDYYMDLADEVFPVIQVGAARKATFVLTQGAELRFAKALSTTPEDTTDAL